MSEIYSIQCTVKDGLFPGEVFVSYKLSNGAEDQLYALADAIKRTEGLYNGRMTVEIVEDLGDDSLLVSLPGEGVRFGSQIKVKNADLVGA